MFREAWSEHLRHDPFQKFCYSAGSTLANGLQQTCQSNGYQVCCCFWDDTKFYSWDSPSNRLQKWLLATQSISKRDLQERNAGRARLVQLHINKLAVHFSATHAPLRCSGSAILVSADGGNCSPAAIEGAAQQVCLCAVLHCCPCSLMQLLYCPGTTAFIVSALLAEQNELCTCRWIWVCVPMCLVGVLLTAQPSVLFGAHGAMSVSQGGVAVGIMQVGNCHESTMLSTCNFKFEARSSLIHESRLYLRVDCS